MKKSQKDFKKEYDELFRSLHGFNPEDVDWFFPEVKKLTDKYGHSNVCQWLAFDESPVYTTALFIKAGLKGFSKKSLIEYSKSEDEYEVEDAAISLAIYNEPEGFEILYQLIEGIHKTSKLVTKHDVLESLEFVKNDNGKKMKNHLIKLIEND